ncbi:MBL fold metallo-hydrolase [Virgibacillus kekensis]|uniref:MBL fold metallo-hydrolase n=1 Tax=Virgibacillus kekensis TaxID=202261 RepID=A0ABV9DJ81_9BACI
MIFKSMPLGPLGTNCYIVHNEKKEALIIDPGGEPEKIINYVEEEQLLPQVILLTHAHFDHIGAVHEVRNYYHLDVYLNQRESDWLENPQQNGSTLFMGEEIRTDAPDHLLKPGKLEFGSISMEAVHTPGHSPGSMTFIFAEDAQIISGDVLFNQGIGRTDLPGGNFSQLEASIRDSLYVLPDNYIVHPGHGPKTTIGDEKRNNPFVPE